MALDHDVLRLRDVAEVPRSLPLPTAPALRDVSDLLLPAISLAFVGLIQGSSISAAIPNPDGSPPDLRGDFVGQGVGSVASGVFQGMPVGGSMSASSLLVTAGARSRAALLVSGVVMAAVILLFGGVVGYVAMPALAGLLIMVGISTVKPARVLSVARVGPIEATVVTTTFVLTMIVPLQYSVLVGVGVSVILHVVRQSQQLRLAQLVFTDDGRVREAPLPAVVPAREVVVVQPCGSLFFASAPALEEQLPRPTPSSTRSVVIIRLRGTDNLGVTAIDVVRRYAGSLAAVGSKLVIISNTDHVRLQLEKSDLVRAIGEDNLYEGTEWLGETTSRAHTDAQEWIAAG